MLFANWNIVTLEAKEHDLYKKGDIYKVPEEQMSNEKFAIFNGLEVKDVSRAFGRVFLTFEDKVFGRRQIKFNFV